MASDALERPLTRFGGSMTYQPHWVPNVDSGRFGLFWAIPLAGCVMARKYPWGGSPQGYSVNRGMMNICCF